MLLRSADVFEGNLTIPQRHTAGKQRIGHDRQHARSFGFLRDKQLQECLTVAYLPLPIEIIMQDWSVYACMFIQVQIHCCHQLVATSCVWPKGKSPVVTYIR